jgi:hypothetical protein
MQRCLATLQQALSPASALQQCVVQLMLQAKLSCCGSAVSPDALDALEVDDILNGQWVKVIVLSKRLSE